MKRIELHTSSFFSDTLSFLYPYQIVSNCAKADCKALAVTDHNSVAAYIMAEEAVKGSGLDLIYGLSIDCIDADDRYTVSLLAKNFKGRENIFRLIYLLNENSNRFGKAVSRQQLEEHREGLLLGASAREGQLSRAITLRRSEAYLKKAARFYDYIEISPEPYDVNTQLMKLSRLCDKPLCAVQYANLKSESDATAFHAYQAIALYRASNDKAEYFVASEELEESFRELYVLPEERARIDEAVWGGPERILDQIEPMPKVQDLLYKDSEKLHKAAMPILTNKVSEAIDRNYRYGPSKTVKDRVLWELEKIDEFGAAEQFLLIEAAAEILRREKQSFSLTGAWASSYVLHLLGVNEIDPLEHKLLPVHLFCDKENLFYAELRMSEAAADMLSKKLSEIYGGQLIGVSHEGSKELSETEFSELLKLYIKEACSEEEGRKLKNNGSFYYMAKYNAGDKVKSNDIFKLYLLPDKKRWQQLPVICNDKNSIMEFESGAYHLDLPNISSVPARMHDVLDACCKIEGIRSESIPFDSAELFASLKRMHQGEEITAAVEASLSISMEQNWIRHQVLDYISPDDFTSVCRSLCLMRGSSLWADNQRELLKNNIVSPDELICCREDVYRYLLKRGAEEKEASDFMTAVRKGKISSRGYSESQKKLLENCGAESWFVDVCAKTQYLFPEAHEMCYAKTMLRIIWLALYGSEKIKDLIIQSAENMLQ